MTISEITWVKVLNDISLAPHRLDLPYTPMSIRYEAAQAAVDILRKYHEQRPDDKSIHTATQCSKCDTERLKYHRHLIGKPCDICGGTGINYLGRKCRHAEASDAEKRKT